MAKLNRMTVAELFCDYFRFYSGVNGGFDLKHQVVSIRSSAAVMKIDKAEKECWHVYDRIRCGAGDKCCC